MTGQHLSCRGSSHGLFLRRGRGWASPSGSRVLGGLSTYPAFAAGLCHHGQGPVPLWASVVPTLVHDRGGVSCEGLVSVLLSGPGM